MGIQRGDSMANIWSFACRAVSTQHDCARVSLRRLLRRLTGNLDWMNRLYCNEFALFCCANGFVQSEECRQTMSQIRDEAKDLRIVSKKR